MKILFVWSGLTGYMGDCWRELTACLDVELKVSVDADEQWFGGSFDADDVLHGLDWSRDLPEQWMPDVIFTVGWHNELCRRAALRDEWVHVPKVCCFDMPWRWQLRCIAARFVLWRYLQRFAAAYVPGQAAHRYARWLGFRKIYDGLFSTDIHRFGVHRGGGGFLCVGRDVSDKGMDVLRAAHKIYKDMGGTLPLKIVNGVSPSALGTIYSEADCFVLASRWEPWGVVLAEAAAAGLPIVCTDRCGARHEVIEDGINGIVVRAESAIELARAMTRVSELDGRAGCALAENYSCSAWTGRVMKIAKELV